METTEEKKPLSPEEQAAADAELVETKRQEAESHKFMRRNPDFPRGVRGANVLRREFIATFGHVAAAWKAENLQTIWDKADKELFDFTDDNRCEAAEPTPEPVVEAPPQTTYPWGLSLTPENDGPARVAKMSGPEMQKFLKNRHTGREFARQVDALNLTRAELQHNGGIKS
jgi:hypothetical protein